MRLFAVLLMLASASVGRCQTPAPKYSLTVSLRESTVKAGGFVMLEITIKNITDKDIMVGKIVGSAESGYEIAVTDSEGKPAAETSYGCKIHGKEPRGIMTDQYSEMLVRLKPGETTDGFIYLSRVYDFTRPGKYTVQLSDTVYESDADVKADRKTVIKSNSVTLTVTN
ncbi:MAG: hypothetical protein ACHQT6_03040 [Candidatus Acidiferrales bacterium]